MIFTLLDRPPLSWPANGRSTGAVPPPGTITMCVSVATIWSPSLAAGIPMEFLRTSASVQIDHRALDVDVAARGLHVEVLLGLELARAVGRGDLDALLAGELDLAVLRLDHHVHVGGQGDRVRGR